MNQLRRITYIDGDGRRTILYNGGSIDFDDVMASTEQAASPTTCSASSCPAMRRRSHAGSGISASVPSAKRCAPSWSRGCETRGSSDET